MSNRLGYLATLGIIGAATLGIYAAPLAYATDTDCTTDSSECAYGDDVDTDSYAVQFAGHGHGGGNTAGTGGHHHKHYTKG